jgi:2-amino-4-hydroxy-6-hydroxymethyldihydropteridine diphosphokinase
MNTAYFLVGGNIGNRENNISLAINLINQNIGKIVRKSSMYQTAPWGNKEQPDFLNQVLQIKTKLNAGQCMEQILIIENKIGRVRTIKNAPRAIDIDILFYNDEVINSPNLTVPHPQIEKRRFVLIPMNELSPNFMHPVLHKSINYLLSTCTDPLEVRLLNDH